MTNSEDMRAAIQHIVVRVAEHGDMAMLQTPNAVDELEALFTQALQAERQILFQQQGYKQGVIDERQRIVAALPKPLVRGAYIVDHKLPFKDVVIKGKEADGYKKGYAQGWNNALDQAKQAINNTGKGE